MIEPAKKDKNQEASADVEKSPKSDLGTGKRTFEKSHKMKAI